ncbi:dihydrouridine synthase, partial [Reticulomyxa filosa]
MIEDKVDAIDINFGCPQNIARRGNYGAYLMDNIPLMEKLIHTCHTHLKIPVCAKVRVFHDDDKTLEMVKRLRKAGASWICVHGRTREQRKSESKACNFDIIRVIKAQVQDIPIFANGGCEVIEDVEQCLQYTKCDGYMAAESLLSNPAMFL